jgi:nucleotide-binding universal stress UspA family protein
LAVHEALETYARSNGADLIVMGAYGHSRLQEFVLGGVTREVLKAPFLPVLLSH